MGGSRGCGGAALLGRPCPVRLRSRRRGVRWRILRDWGRRRRGSGLHRKPIAAGLDYLELEVRQDLIADGKRVARWVAILAPLIAATRDALA